MAYRNEIELIRDSVRDWKISAVLQNYSLKTCNLPSKRPQGIGKVERMIRTLSERLRTDKTVVLENKP